MLYKIIVILISILAIIIAICLQINHVPYYYLPLWIAIAVGGIPAVFNILVRLLRGDLGADLLAALAIITAIIVQQYYAGVIVILMLATGQGLESYAKRKASSVLLALSKRMPSVAHRRTLSSSIEDIPLLNIQIGDEIVILPHETSPVDGEVIEGRSSMDESYLTGEPYQISKIPGSMIISGAINGSSVLIIRAQKLPADSRYASIVKVLQDAEQKRTAIRRIGDQIGAVFAPIALIIAIAAWYFTGEVIRFLAVLVIATPCPLLIAIPITLISAISMAARHSIIIKDPALLEQLPLCRTAIFDKTGTLTYGKPSLTKIVTKSDNDFILQQVASLERYSKHPLAGAVIEAAQQKQLKYLQVSRISETPGQGLSGYIGERKILITNRKTLSQFYPKEFPKLTELPNGLECIVLVDDEYQAILQFHDIPRQESKSFISHLQPAHRLKKSCWFLGIEPSEVAYLGKLLKLTEIKASKPPVKSWKLSERNGSKRRLSSWVMA